MQGWALIFCVRDWLQNFMARAAVYGRQKVAPSDGQALCGGSNETPARTLMEQDIVSSAMKMFYSFHAKRRASSVGFMQQSDGRLHSLGPIFNITSSMEFRGNLPLPSSRLHKSGAPRGSPQQLLGKASRWWGRQLHRVLHGDKTKGRQSSPRGWDGKAAAGLERARQQDGKWQQAPSRVGALASLQSGSTPSPLLQQGASLWAFQDSGEDEGSNMTSSNSFCRQLHGDVEWSLVSGGSAPRWRGTSRIGDRASNSSAGKVVR